MRGFTEKQEWLEKCRTDDSPVTPEEVCEAMVDALISAADDVATWREIDTGSRDYADALAALNNARSTILTAAYCRALDSGGEVGGDAREDIYDTAIGFDAWWDKVGEPLMRCGHFNYREVASAAWANTHPAPVAGGVDEAMVIAANHLALAAESACAQAENFAGYPTEIADLRSAVAAYHAATLVCSGGGQ